MDHKDNTDTQLNDCLFFTSCKLARVLGNTAEDEFKVTGLSPSHAFLLHIVNISNGLGQKQIGEVLHMSPSTITRFVEKLENKGLVSRESEGKNVNIFKTEKGLLLQPDIDIAWKHVYEIYADILTVEECEQFISTANKIITKLESK